jgi:DNA-binding transcriptional ArsR family regulator
LKAITYSLSMPGIPESALEDVARRFALLGDPSRLRILRVLHQHGALAVGEIASAAGVSVANASQHLGRLAVGGVVGRQRQGRSVVYRIMDETIEQLCTTVCSSLAATRLAAAQAVGAEVHPAPRAG